MTELQPYTGFLDVQTGELLEPTVANAAHALKAARDMKVRINYLVDEATRYLVAESARVGSKTLHAGDETITLSGGVMQEYDAHDLMEALRTADCPEERIEEAVVAVITYKVNRSVLRQLAAANPDYKAAIELAVRDVERPWRAKV
jgi:hypothetical protein